MKKKEPFIFVSYSHQDTQQVLPIIQGLQARGFRVWYDAGIQAGTEWPEFIARKVYDCGCLLAIVTHNSADSPNCRREINFALELKKDLLSVYMIEPDELSLGLRMQLNTLQAIFVKNSPDRETFLDTLALAEILKPCRGEWTEAPEEESEAIQTALQKQPETDEEAPLNTPVLWEDGESLLRQGIKKMEAGEAEEAFDLFSRSAQKGNAEAMYRLYQHFRDGGDPERAYHYCKLAAKQGVTEAMLRQGKDYELTNGTAKGREVAFLQFSIAAKLGNVEAMYELGVCYLEGIGTDTDEEAAITWLENAAQQEWAPAMYRLGLYYRYGENSQPRDLEKARKWFDSAAYWRHSDGMFELGKLINDEGHWQEATVWFERALECRNENAAYALEEKYWTQIDNLLYGRQIKDDPAFLAWCRIGAELGCRTALMCMGKLCELEEKYTEAADYYQRAAEAGFINARDNLADLYQKGLGVEKDESKAFEMYQEAYERSYGTDLHAVYRLGCCYRDGKGIAKDAKKAYQFFEDAADRGHSESAWELVACYYHGFGTDKNLEAACHWCRDAAERGHVEAMYTLRKFYAEGIGTETDPCEAFRWCKKAAEHDQEDAMFQLGCYYAEGFGTEASPTDSFAWFQRAAAKGHATAYVAEAMCHFHGFGTPREVNQGIRMMDRKPHPDGLYEIARHFEKDGDLFGAYHFYRRAAGMGHEEAYTFLTTDQTYRRKLRFRAYMRVEHRNTVRGFEMNRGCYQPAYKIPKKD